MSQQQNKKSTLKIVLTTIMCTVIAIIIAIGLIIHHISSEFRLSSQNASQMIQRYQKEQEPKNNNKETHDFSTIPTFGQAEETNNEAK